MKLFCRYSFWFARMRSDSPKTSKTPDLKGRLNMCEGLYTDFIGTHVKVYREKLPQICHITTGLHPGSPWGSCGAKVEMQYAPPQPAPPTPFFLLNF